MIPVLNENVRQQIKHVEDLIKSEVNIKEIEFISDTDGVITKKIKPNFKTLGPKLGGDMKLVAEQISAFSQKQITDLEKSGTATIETPHNTVVITTNDVEIMSQDIPGWLVANAGNVTIALDISLTQQLIEEGHAREFVSLMQKMRKEKDLAITDRIKVSYSGRDGLAEWLVNYKAYICAEILADSLEYETELPEFEEILVNEILIKVFILKI